LSSFRGKVVILEFMEPWCPHCQDATPNIEKLYQQYGSQNVVFLSVAGPWSGPDGKFTNPDDVAGFIRNYKSSWTYVYDSSGTVMTTYGVTSTPTFVIVNKNGSIVGRIEGDQPNLFDSLIAIITQASR